MSIVLDCSVTLSWYLVDEDDESSRQIREHVTEHGGVVPIHWRAEMANGLLMAWRRGRIAKNFIAEAFQRFDSLVIVTDVTAVQTVELMAMKMAVENNLTIYDALYLETAHRLELPLATFDKALQRAANAAGVPILGDVTP